MSVKVLQDAKEALEALNLDEIVKIYANRFLFEDVSANEQITDRKALKEYFQRLFSLPQVSFSDIRIFEGECFAILEWTWGGVKRNTGEPFRVKGVSVIELSEGKIARESIYYDPKPALS
jgi:ketosteroid isomerase-like protein